MVAKTKTKRDIKKSIIKTIDQLGGISKFIKTGQTVMLKPNFNTADPYPASTSLDFLKAMVEICYSAGAKIVMIAESSTMSLNTRKVMEKVGVFDLLQMEKPPRIYVLEEREWVKKKIPNAKYLKSVKIPKILERPDKLILLPCLKTHFQAQYTGSLKLSVAYMAPYQRVALHARKIEEKIAELNTLIKPDLVVMDARKCFITKGPSHGRLAEPNLIMASLNRVELDIEGIKTIQGFPNNDLAGLVPEELPQIKRALDLGIK